MSTGTGPPATSRKPKPPPNGLWVCRRLNDTVRLRWARGATDIVSKVHWRLSPAFVFFKETVRRAVMRVSFIPPQRIKEDDTAKLALAYFLPVCLDLKIFWPRRKETHNVCGRE